MAKGYKHKKRGAGRFVQLSEHLQRSAAWATLKPGPRALYIELKRRFNGQNNGRIILSHRDAAAACNCHRNTVGPWFEELKERGFIRMECSPYLGPDGVGKAALWALTELVTVDGKPATNDFRTWQELQKPRTKTLPDCPKNCAKTGKQRGTTTAPVLKIVTR